MDWICTFFASRFMSCFPRCIDSPIRFVEIPKREVNHSFCFPTIVTLLGSALFCALDFRPTEGGDDFYSMSISRTRFCWRMTSTWLRNLSAKPTLDGTASIKTKGDDASDVVI